MRPFPQSGFGSSLASALGLCALMAVVATCDWGCAHVSAGPSPNPPPTGDDISVVVAPPSASVLLGNQVVFTAAVHNTTDTAVTWSVNGAVGGAADVGTITGAGVYNAPVDLPVAATLQVTA